MRITSFIATVITVGTVLALSSAFGIRPGHVALKGTEPVSPQELTLKRTAEFHLPRETAHLAANFISGSEYLYLTDLDRGRIIRADWRTGSVGEWVNLDSTGCPDLGLVQVHVIKTVGLLAVSICDRIELLDATSLSTVKVLSEEKNLDIMGSDLSSDDRSLAVTVRKVLYSSAYAHHVHAEDPYTIIYDASDWTPGHERPFAYGYYTPDDHYLATVYSTGEGYASTRECGFRLYDPSSGKLTSQVVARTNEENVGCPSFPLYFRASEPSQIIVDDYVQSAVSEWDIASGKLVRYLQDETTGPGPAPVTDSLSVSHDGRLAAVVRSRDEGVPDYSVTIWDLSDGKPVYHTLARSVSDPVRGIFFSPYGKIVAFVYAGRVEVYQYDVR